MHLEGKWRRSIRKWRGKGEVIAVLFSKSEWGPVLEGQGLTEPEGRKGPWALEDSPSSTRIPWLLEVYSFSNLRHYKNWCKKVKVLLAFMIWLRAGGAAQWQSGLPCFSPWLTSINLRLSIADNPSEERSFQERYPTCRPIGAPHMAAFFVSGDLESELWSGKVKGMSHAGKPCIFWTWQSQVVYAGGRLFGHSRCSTGGTLWVKRPKPPTCPPHNRRGVWQVSRGLDTCECVQLGRKTWVETDGVWLWILRVWTWLCRSPGPGMVFE